MEVVAQPGWSSIGYALPAVAGAQLASAPRRRAVLVIGDGAAQLTIQEIGTLAREGLDPVIVLVNNEGYTVERAINGPDAAYNDITPWNWQAIPAAFGASAVVAQARTAGQLEEELARLSASGNDPDAPPGGVPGPARPAAAAEADRRCRRPAQRTVDRLLAQLLVLAIAPVAADALVQQLGEASARRSARALVMIAL